MVINNLLYFIAHIIQLCVRYDLWRSLSHSKWTYFYAHSTGCVVENQLETSQLDEKFKEQKSPRQLWKHEISFTFFCWCSAQWDAEPRQGLCFSFYLSWSVVHAQSLIYVNRREEKIMLGLRWQTRFCLTAAKSSKSRSELPTYT